MTSLIDLATSLDKAAGSATATRQLTVERELTLAEAYEIQHAVVGLRAARGDDAVGIKLGFTSKAKAIQMGVCDVIVGEITASMRVEDGGSVDVSRWIHPRIEPEIAFRLSRAVDPHDPKDEIADAVVSVAPAMEIIDSRYKDFAFTLEDVVADNTSAAGFVLGAWRSYADVGHRLDNLGVILEIDGVIADTGSTSAILGHPTRALEAVKRMARTWNLALPEGTIILAGAATAAAPLTAGSTVSTSITGLGSVGITTEASHV